MPKRKIETSANSRLLGVLKVDTGSKPLFGLSFWPGSAEKQKDSREEKDAYYFCTVGGNTASVYAIVRNQNEKLRVEVSARQRYIDEDDSEQFYTCAWTQAERIKEDAMSPLLIVAGAHGAAKIIDCSDTSLNGNALSGHGNAINDCKTHPVHPWLLVTASKDESARLWNIITRKCIAIFAGDRGHRDEVLSCDLHLLGRLLCTAGMDNTIKIWRLDSPEIATAISNSNSRAAPPHTVQEPFPVFSTLDIHSNYVDCARFIGNFIVSKSTSDKIILWTPDLDRVQRIQEEHSLLSGVDLHSKTHNTVSQPSWPPRGAAPASSTLFLRDFDLPHADIWFMRFALDRSHSFLAAGNKRGTVTLWNLQNDSLDSPPIAKLSHPRTSYAVRQVAFSPDSNLLAFCCDDASLAIFDVSDLCSNKR